MINGIKVSMVYHLYCSEKDFEDNVYNEINRRCLEHFHDIFDEVLFCVCVDDTNNVNLIQRAIKWIWSCGFKDNVTIKVKPNTPFFDSQTFFDEVTARLNDFDGMLFFGHNKGNTREVSESMKKWIIYSYYSILDNIENHISNLCNNTVAYVYVPVADDSTKKTNENRWLASGTYMLFNPSKLIYYSKVHGIKIPDKMYDRFYAEQFLPSMINVCDNDVFRMEIRFDHWINGWLEAEWVNMYEEDHTGIISQFLSEERVKQYEDFYSKITEGL